MLDINALLAMSAILLGSFVQTAVGFGLAIVAAPLLILISPDYVPAPICLVALFISLLSSRKLKDNMDIGGLKMAIIGRIPGSVVGGVLLVLISSEILTLWVGIMVLLAVGISYLPFRVEPTPRRMAIAGFFSGVFGTSSAIGGPPMALLLQHQEANNLRANLSAFFVFSSFISLIVQVPAGVLTLHHVWLTLPLIPAAWLGYWLGHKAVAYISKETIRQIILVLCVGSGLTAIIKSVFF